MNMNMNMDIELIVTYFFFLKKSYYVLIEVQNTHCNNYEALLTLPDRLVFGRVLLIFFLKDI